MRYTWTVEAVTHIARHGLVPAQVEQVVEDVRRVLVEVCQVGGEERGVVLGACEGSTEAAASWVVVVVFTIRAGAVRVVTAYRARGRQRAPYDEATAAPG